MNGRRTRRTFTDRSEVYGGLVWVGMVLIGGIDLSGTKWAAYLIALATLVIVPLSWHALMKSRGWMDSLPLATRGLLEVIDGLLLVTALSLNIALVQAPGPNAAVCAAIWLGTTLLIGLAGMLRLTKAENWRPDRLAISAGMIYLVVGGVGAVLDRGGWTPLGFDPAIIQLTAVHFHYAGFVLPIAAGLAAGRLRTGVWGRVARATCIGVVVSIPLTGLGITASQLGWGHGLETVAACAMAGSGLLVALLHQQLAIQEEGAPALARVAWGLAGGFLVLGMVLAALYGLRWVTPPSGLTIPRMRMFHGTLNAIGFALPVALGWRLAAGAGRRETSSPNA